MGGLLQQESLWASTAAAAKLRLVRGANVSPALTARELGAAE